MFNLFKRKPHPRVVSVRTALDAEPLPANIDTPAFMRRAPEQQRAVDEMRDDDMEEQIEIKNAVIEEVFLKPSDLDGFSVLYIQFKLGDSRSGFLGYRLHNITCLTESKNPATFSEHCFNRVLKISNASCLNDLVGKSIRVKCLSSGPIAIGHIIEDDWFDQREEFKKMKGGD